MKKTYTLAAVAILFWSTVATITKLPLNDCNQFQVLWVSSVFAAVFVACVDVAYSSRNP